MIIVLGVALGLLAGILIPYTYNPQYSLYITIAILACLDSLLGGVRAILSGDFDNAVFISGFFMNAIFAGFFAFLGDKLGVPLYYAPIVTFGGRMFDNFAKIRRIFIKKLRSVRTAKKDLNNSKQMI